MEIGFEISVDEFYVILSVAAVLATWIITKGLIIWTIVKKIDLGSIIRKKTDYKGFKREVVKDENK